MLLDTEGSQMNTMDVRIKITEEVIKERDAFSDDFSNESNMPNSNSEKVIKSNIVTKVKIFQRKCLARLSSLNVR